MPQNEHADGHGGRRASLPVIGAIPADASPPAPVDRRTFLKLAGFAFGAAAVGGCQRTPVQEAVPPLIPVEGLVPGRVSQYAAACGACSAGCGLLVQNRDGRPIKLEGNPDHPLSRGGLCAVGQASILGLYDSQRLWQPIREGKPVGWAEVDTAVRAELESIRKKGGAVRVLTSTLTGPTVRDQLQKFLGGFKDARHVVFDPLSCSAIPDAHALTHGIRALPRYYLDRAEVIVAVDADFLGTWIAPVELAAAYQSNRRLDGPAPHLSRHFQFESRLSLTGSKADQRFRISPDETGPLLAHLAERLAKKAGTPAAVPATGSPPVPAEVLDEVADALWQTRRRCVVLCGSQDTAEQVLCNRINHLLGNYGTTVDLDRSSHQKEGRDRDVQALLAELHAGGVAALIIYASNPLYDLPGGDVLAADLGRVPLMVSCAERLDETAAVARLVCPVPHYLEEWRDAEPVEGVVELSQPAIRPFGETRPFVETLAAWSGRPRPAYDLVRETWEKRVYPRRVWQGSFPSFWESAVQVGYARVQPAPARARAFDSGSLRALPEKKAPSADEYTVVLYPKVGMPEGAHAYNPWLQELPDPISKGTWDNYACFSPALAARLGVSDGDVVRLEGAGGGVALELPALVQPGQHDGVVAVALGYGSRLSERFAAVGPRWLEGGPTVGADGRVGVNAAPLLSWEAGTLRQDRATVRVTRTGRRRPVAVAQVYPSLEPPPQLAPPGRQAEPVVRETTLAALVSARETGKPAEAVAPGGQESGDLWPADHPVTGHRWGMAVDLNACTGCSACVIACQVENNVPVVGRDEVLRHREMHWLRIDRYYVERDAGTDVAHQPMLCQHCGNAPCEVVCPVLATVHSEEGLNEQVYNRCVGTRYCANNCPYKVRRFNWFEYARDDLLANLVLNPSVTVRSRGVMEKCTFCVQRIERARIEAHASGRELADGDVRTACQQSCPTQAIVFGDLNDPKSRVAQRAHGPRAYGALEELNVKPAVRYLAVVRNRPQGAGEGGHE